MAGGLAKNSGMWSLGSKTWRAPSEQERQLEKRQRLLHEAEERKIKDVKQQTRNLLEARELERKMNRVDQYALGAELGSRMGDLRRARSFGSYGMAGMREKLALEAEVSRARQVRELEADRLRGERIRQESEFIHRSRQNSAIRAQQEMAAVRAAQIPLGGGMGYGGLPVPMVRQRSHSFGGVVPPMGIAGHGYGYTHSPYLGPMGSAGLARVPSMTGLSSPGLMRHPSLNNLASPGLVHRTSMSNLASPGLGRRPSLNNLNMSAPPQPVVNYNTYNIGSPNGLDAGYGNALPVGGRMGHSPRSVGRNYPSPHEHYVDARTSPYMGGHSAHISPAGLGGLDDFAGYSRSPRAAPLLDPLVDTGYVANAPLFTPRAPSPRMTGRASPYGSPNMGGGIPFPSSAPQQEFVMTDQDYEPGRTIVRELGTAEGFSSSGDGGYNQPEEELIQLAMADLLQNARGIGANGVLSLSVAGDPRGGVVARGRAVVLR